MEVGSSVPGDGQSLAVGGVQPQYFYEVALVPKSVADYGLALRDTGQLAERKRFWLRHDDDQL
jgi:hypothetical protein